MNTMVKLEKEVAQLREKLAKRDAQVESPKEKIRLFLHRKFSPSSEKFSPGQLGLFNESESIAEEAPLEQEADTTTVKSHERKRKPRISIPEEFPREDIIHDLSEEDKICPHDGAELELISSDDLEQLDIIPAQIKVIRHRLLKYACPCCEEPIKTAARSTKLPIDGAVLTLILYNCLLFKCQVLLDQNKSDWCMDSAKIYSHARRTRYINFKI